MKKLLFILILLFSLSGFSQEVTFEKGKFFQNGTQLSSYDTKKLLETNYQAYSLFKKGKSKESWGGFLLGFGGGMIIGDLVKGLVSNETFPSVATYVGLGTMALSIPILSGKNAKIEKAIAMYNEGLKETGNQGTNLEFTLVSNTSGIGFVIQF